MLARGVGRGGPNEDSENAGSDLGPRRALTTTAIIQMTKPRPRDLPRVWREKKKGDECLAIPWGVRFRQDDVSPPTPVLETVANVHRGRRGGKVGRTYHEEEGPGDS